MKINFSNGAIIETLQVLNKFGNVRGKLGYAISRTKKLMLEELKPFEDERNKLIQKYGEKSEDGDFVVKPNTDNYKKFIEEILPLTNEISIPIDVFQVSQEEFDNNESIFECENAAVKDFDMLSTLFVKHEIPNDETDKDE